MIEGLPGYISVVFVLTTLLTVGIFFYAIYRAGLQSTAAKVLLAFTLLWLILQAILALKGFFQDFDVIPPRTFAFGPLPFFILTFAYLIFGRQFLDQLPLSRRIKDLKRLRTSADVFVIHNTNRMGNWLSEFWPYLETFNYIYVFPAFPATVVCSDKIDVRLFF